ncbi:MAG: hypothetical protein CK425_00105 [Parachlamydia sp.]|nr:MAG: hypothetical protein CK425_00105 [Parachlamydia sp.]
MFDGYFAVISYHDALFFILAILGVFLLLLIAFGFGVWLSKQKDSVSPYTGLPLRFARDLHFETKEKIVRYLYHLHQYDNRIFEFSQASFCRETGRIFPYSVTWFGTIDLDWTFLKKRYPGSYVSWGSLSPIQQQAISDKHTSLEGFQTEISSPNPSPRAVAKEYAFCKPGPLCVDLETYVLLGWKEVPGTDMEVLIVQKPIVPYAIKVLEDQDTPPL